MLEVEQKFAVDQLDALATRLVALGTELQTPIAQCDLYFAHPVRDFAATDEALRIRQVGLSNCVTYKGPKLDATTKTRHEIEVPLAAGEASASDFTQLLEALGFRRVAEVRKQRRPGRLAWQGWTVEIALDNIGGLGTFAELEILAETRDVDAARACIQSLADELGLTHGERRSYLELLLQAQGATP